MKKNWIFVKRGMLEPKHREALGIRVWLYMHILDRADWEDGAVVEWVDAAEADEMQMPIRTLRQQRRDAVVIESLESSGRTDQVMRVRRMLAAAEI